MYFPNAASGNEWNRMATLSIRFYSLHPWVHCVLYSNFGYIFTTDCTDYTDFSSQEATMAGCRTIRMAGAAEAQKSASVQSVVEKHFRNLNSVIWNFARIYWKSFVFRLFCFKTRFLYVFLHTFPYLSIHEVIGYKTDESWWPCADAATLRAFARRRKHTGCIFHVWSQETLATLGAFE